MLAQAYSDPWLIPAERYVPVSKTTSPVRAQLAALASRLGARRNAILQAWRRAVDGDPLSESGAKLSRAQFFDHIPEVLDSFEHLLSTATEEEDRRPSGKIVTWPLNTGGYDGSKVTSSRR